METTTNETATQQNEQTLQLKRKLVPIDEYAKREGISIGIVEQCAGLGIIQIRKFKGETFVVDVPLNPSVYSLDANTETTQFADKSTHAQKLSELVKRIMPEEFETSLQTTNSKLDSIGTKTTEITDSIKNIFCKSPLTEVPPTEIIDEPIEFTVQTDKTENAFDSILDELKSQPIDVPVHINDEILETEEMTEQQQVPENNKLLFGFMDSQAKSKRTWQTIALSAITAFLILLLLTLWLHNDRKEQLSMLDQANTNMQAVIAGSSIATNKIKTLQNQLDMYKGEFKRLRNELNTSRAQFKTTQSELADTQKNLKIIKQRDTAIIERLDAQIKNLLARLNLLTQNPQSPK